jgi:hypothetical protein
MLHIRYENSKIKSLRAHIGYVLYCRESCLSGKLESEVDTRPFCIIPLCDYVSTPILVMSMAQQLPHGNAGVIHCDVFRRRRFLMVARNYASSSYKVVSARISSAFGTPRSSLFVLVPSLCSPFFVYFRGLRRQARKEPRCSLSEDRCESSESICYPMPPFASTDSLPSH